MSDNPWHKVAMLDAETIAKLRTDLVCANSTIVSLRAELEEATERGDTYKLSFRQAQERADERTVERDTALRELGAMARRVEELEHKIIGGAQVLVGALDRIAELTALLRQAQREWMTPGQPSWERVDAALATAEAEEQLGHDPPSLVAITGRCRCGFGVDKARHAELVYAIPDGPKPECDDYWCGAKTAKHPKGNWNRGRFESGWTIKHCGETCWMEPETKFFCCGVCGKVYQRPEEK